jgi:hypothetical protein
MLNINVFGNDRMGDRKKKKKVAKYDKAGGL